MRNIWGLGKFTLLVLGHGCPPLAIATSTHGAMSDGDGGDAALR